MGNVRDTSSTTYAATADIVKDIRTIKCAVGRVQCHNECSIIDHSEDFSHTVFVDDEDDE